MSDIFREVDEDVRQDKALELWNRFQPAVLGLAVAIVAGTAIWTGYAQYRLHKAEAASAKFEAALQLSREGRAGEAYAAFNALAADAPAGYRTLARLRGAEELSLTDRDGAVKALDALAADASVGAAFQNVARLRAALLRLDVADAAELDARLGPLSAPGAPFRMSAREFLALAALNRGDFEAAGRYLDRVVADPGASAEERARAGSFMSLVRGGKVSTAAPAPALTPFMPPAAPPAPSK